MKNAVTAQEVRGMVEHWLSTPPSGYLGQSYGSDPQALLQQPLSSGLGDAFVDRMLRDIPILGALPRGTVNVDMVERDNESTSLIIEIGGTRVSIDNVDKSKLTR